MKSSKFALWRLYWLNYKDRGFVLPIAIGLGLIAVLVGTIMLTRSFRDQTDVVARQAATGSESLAELGVTRYLDLINQFRAIASVPACGTPWQGESCGDDKIPSWYAISNPNPEQNNTKLKNLIGDVKQPAKTFSGSVTADDIPSCTANTAKNTDAVVSFANRSWRDSTDKAADGQFRLIDYVYDPGNLDDATDDVGTLTVEGRVRQVGSGSTAKETTGTGITRLQVKFPVELQPPWGLWIRGDSPVVPDKTMTAASGSVQANTEIRDSGCADGNMAKTRVAEINPLLSQGVKYISTPGKYNQDFFPDAPTDGTRLPRTGLGLTISSNYLLGEGSYRIFQNLSKNSLVITDKGKLTVDAPGKKVKIVLQGALDVAGVIEVTKGTTLELYAGDRIIVRDTGKLKNDNSNTPDNFQIYTLADSVSSLGGTQFELIGGGTIDNVFIFAPYQLVKQNDSSQITGTLWARSWQSSSSSAKFQQGKSPVFSNLAIAAKTTTTLDEISLKKIGNTGIRSWRRCAVTTGC